jgi:acetyl-CoA acetyltransferase
VTLEEVLASPVIADPLTLMQCCPKTDGSAAAVLVSEKAMKRLGGRPVRIRATALGSGVPVFTDKPVTPTPKRVALKALEQAGVEPKDLDVVEVHDAFTIGEILYTEALGLCPPGEGGKYAASGKSLPNSGFTAVNTSGGLLSRGHPLGASGLAQIGEIVTQLRGAAGPRQVEGARLGAVHTMGANEFELDANVCSVFVLEAA